MPLVAVAHWLVAVVFVQEAFTASVIAEQGSSFVVGVSPASTAQILKGPAWALLFALGTEHAVPFELGARLLAVAAVLVSSSALWWRRRLKALDLSTAVAGRPTSG